MKIRNDFVSNSSSSSFIVSVEDNPFDILLSNPTVITLRQYVSEYLSSETDWYNDVFGQFKNRRIRFVEDDEFTRLFKAGKSLAKIAPKSVKDLMPAYLNIVHMEKPLPDMHDFVEHVRNMFEGEIERRVYECFCKDEDLKNMLFCIKNIDDCQKNETDNEYNSKQYSYYERSEDDRQLQQLEGVRIDMLGGSAYTIEIVRKRIALMNSLKPLKFYREFY